MNNTDTSESNVPALKLDHIGIAVLNLDEAITRYKSQYGGRLLEREIVASQGADVAFLEVGGATLELLAPLGGLTPEQVSPPSALSRFLIKRGPGLHHLCFEVEDIASALECYRRQGLELVDETPRPGSRQTLVAFLHPRSSAGVLWELCQSISR